MPEPLALRSAQVVVPCRDFAATFGFLRELGFQVELVTPADAPSLAVLSGFGCALRLERSERDAELTLHLGSDADPVPAEREGPGGLRVRFERSAPARPPAPFAPAFVLTRAGEAPFLRGRAGMDYRDLLPGRLGGRYIASHIRIAAGGPVSDWVHHHDVRFQMIYCRSGWVRVVYEDQGPPFVLEAGDCVLQPPGIRHRVLESAPGVEVIEVGSPAEHDTHADHALELPTAAYRPAREFAGQRFVRHVAGAARWLPGPAAVEVRDTGVAAATRGLADVRVSRTNGNGAWRLDPGAAELAFLYVLEGRLILRAEDIGTHTLGRDDCCALPPDAQATLEAAAGLELLEVRVYATERAAAPA